jgi:CHASE3 domain sensor protein
MRKYICSTIGSEEIIVNVDQIVEIKKMIRYPSGIRIIGYLTNKENIILGEYNSQYAHIDDIMLGIQNFLIDDQKQIFVM